MSKAAQTTSTRASRRPYLHGRGFGRDCEADAPAGTLDPLAAPGRPFGRRFSADPASALPFVSKPFRPAHVRLDLVEQAQLEHRRGPLALGRLRPPAGARAPRPARAGRGPITGAVPGEKCTTRRCCLAGPHSATFQNVCPRAQPRPGLLKAAPKPPAPPFSPAHSPAHPLLSRFPACYKTGPK